MNLKDKISTDNDGYRHGLCLLYRDQFVSHINYHHGIFHGVFKQFENNNLVSIGCFKMGREHGFWKNKVHTSYFLSII